MSSPQARPAVSTGSPSERASPGRAGGRFVRARRVVKALVPLAAFGLALAFLHEELARTPFTRILAALRATEPLRIVAAGALTLGSFVVLAAYDVLGLRYAGARLALRHSREPAS